jgi:protein-S-isoprenylcysteine O-methyltransferase Ste14
MRVVSAPPNERLLPAVAGIAAINALIAVLFLLRRPLIALGSWVQLVSCLPTMIGFGLSLSLAPSLAQWPWPAHVLFACGAALTITAFLSLGGSFGVLPALRAAVTCGPYRIVRHPAYAGELVMAVACFAAGPSLPAILPWLLLLPGVVWRILAEESVLARDEEYSRYQSHVRWRLVPGIW